MAQQSKSLLLRRSDLDKHMGTEWAPVNSDALTRAIVGFEKDGVRDGFLQCHVPNSDRSALLSSVLGLQGDKGRHPSNRRSMTLWSNWRMKCRLIVDVLKEEPIERSIMRHLLQHKRRMLSVRRSRSRQNGLVRGIPKLTWKAWKTTHPRRRAPWQPGRDSPARGLLE